MARYSAYLGRAVEVQYRAGDIFFPASGTFVADSGRSIFLEQHYEQLGQLKNFRWEIPYQCIVRLEEAQSESPTPAPQNPDATASPSSPSDQPLHASAARAGAGSSVLTTAPEPTT